MGSLIETGAYLEGWGLSDLATMVVSVLHKNYNAKWKSSSTRNWILLSRWSETNLNFQHLNKLFMISPNEVFD